MENAPTIRTLAKTAGVSKTTISLALRDNPRISLELRKRIKRIAAEAGYKPNAIVANLFAQLRSNKTSTYHSTLGLLCVAKDLKELKAVTTFKSWIAGFEAQAAERGYGFDQLWLYEPGITRARLAQILDARNITGMALIGFYEGETMTREYDPIWRRSAMVAIGTRPQWPAIHFVSNDQYVTVVRAVRELVALGYSRPGLCIGSHVDDIVENKFSAGFWAAQKWVPSEESLPIFNLQSNSDEGFAHWFKQHRPDAILTIHREVWQWVTQMGMSVPEDVALVHLDKTHETADWAGMAQNSELIGRAAVDMVIGQLHRNEAGIPPVQKCMLINSTWSSGLTVRASSPAPAGVSSRRGARNPNARSRLPGLRISV